MRSRLQQLCAILCVTLPLMACVPDTVDVNVQVTAPEPQGRLPATDSTGAMGATAESVKCTKYFTVSESDDEHLQKDHELRIRGPFDGDYRLQAMPSTGTPDHHVVLDKQHLLLQADEAGDTFTGVFDIKGGPHQQVRQHLYNVEMEIDASAGCPTKLTFTTQPHVDPDGGDDHGGHAVAN